MESTREILQRNGFFFKKKFGQNFITDENLLAAIAEDAGVAGGTALEIGAGAGTLTRALAARAKEVLAYEIDEKLRPVLAETLQNCPNVRLIFGDFLRVDLAELEQTLPPYTVAANLPYYITTPLVMKFIEGAKKAKALVVMVQDDVAKRFCATADTPEYGAVTAAIALRARAEIVRHVPRRMFYPVPNVDSAVVKLTFEENRIPVQDAGMYRRTVRAAFLSRRKTLENNLMTAFSLPREEAKAALAAAGVPENARGETLSPARLARLADVLCEQCKG